MPLYLRVFKTESLIEVWANESPLVEMVLVETISILGWSGTLGPKLAEGDMQAPEGFYGVTAGFDESPLAIPPSLRPRIPERIRSSARPHREPPDDSRRIGVCWLLRHRRRSD